MKILLAAALSGFVLCAADKTTTYTCASGESFQVTLQKKGTRALVAVPGKAKITLPQAGNQYSDGFTVLSVEGTQATLAAGSVHFKNCTDATVKAAPAASLLGKWTLATLQGRTVSLPRPPFLEFKADGGAAGLAGCNRLNTGYVSSGASLRFEGAVVTRMACIGEAMTVEEDFLKALNQTAGYTISAKTLTLRNAAGQLLATLTKD